MVSGKLTLYIMPWSLELILEIFWVFSVLWEYHCYCHITEERENIQQDVSSIISVQKSSEIKIKFHTGACNHELKSDFKKILTFPKISQISSNFMPWYTGVIFHLPRVNMHQKISNHVGSHHVEGFQDCSMYKENRYAKTIDTCDE